MIRGTIGSKKKSLKKTKLKTKKIRKRRMIHTLFLG